ncbi:MAG TPA: cupin domain-containing protein [Phenylobacterium sp.]|nr:cupin domain-containing protein [Phenylobacterium sp.]
MAAIDSENLRVDALIGTPCPPVEATVAGFDDLGTLRARWAQLDAVPLLLERPEDGCDHGFGGLGVRTLLRGEQSAGRFSVHSISLAPGAALPRHYHLDAHCFVIVSDGELELAVGALAERMGKYGFGYVPPRTHCAIHNRSSAAATVTVVYSPAGADRAFAEAHEHGKLTGDGALASCLPILERFGFRFDDAPLENDHKTNTAVPPIDLEIQAPGDLERLRREFIARPPAPRLTATPEAEFAATPTDVTFRKELLNGDVSGGTAMVNLLSGPASLGAPSHYQPTEEEFFFVMEGQLEVTCASQTKVTTAGAVAFCPRNATHGFRNASATERTRFITLNSPAGHERAMASVRRAAQDGASREQLHELSAVGGFIFH